jgi:glycosyltransferase involved in cell wall biosynthesis
LLVVADGLGEEEIDGIKVLDVGKPKGRLQRIFTTSKEVVKKALEQKADIYHFHDPEILLWVGLLKKSGAKIVYDVHEDLPRQLLSKPYLTKSILKFVSHFAERFENKKAKHCDMVITVTPLIVNRFAAFHPNVLRLANFPLKIEFQKNELAKENYICYVGGLTVTRGVYQMLDLAQKIDVPLKIAGIPDSDDILQKLKNTPNVEYLGVLDRSEVTKLISQAKIGLCMLHPIPNYLEAYPIKIFEYMAAGTPVLASDFPLYKEIVEGSQSGICAQPFDVDKIAELVAKILSDDNKIIQMGENGRKTVRKNYSWESEAQNWLDQYRKLISSIN